MIEQATTTKPLTTLQDVYTYWLELPHGSPARAEAGLTNNDRGVTDQHNYRRALRCLAVATNGRIDQLELCPADVLEASPTVIGLRVMEGAKGLAARQNKPPPNDKTIRNTVSCCRAIQHAVFEHKIQKSTHQRLIALPKRRLRKKFSYNDWPAELLRQWRAFSDWKCQKFIPEHERRFRKKICRPQTIESKRQQLNGYIGYVVGQGRAEELTLEMLCNPATYQAYLNVYFAQEADGGHRNAKNNTVTLALITQYLVAKGELLERTESGRAPWDQFYDIGQDILKDGAETGSLPEPKGIGSWKPCDLRTVAQQGRKLSEQKAQNPSSLAQRQSFNLYRTALFFYLAYETPLRHRNWREMRWGKNLWRRADGRWEVRFEGAELKVGQRQFVTNVYQHVYSAAASAWIDGWRERLCARFGNDFERVRPYVFTVWNHECKSQNSPLAGNVFHYHVTHLVMELRGEPFNPHMVRHIIGTYLVNEFGPKGLGLAAKLLGDTPEVVLKTYYRPNNEEALVQYLDMGVVENSFSSLTR